MDKAIEYRTNAENCRALALRMERNDPQIASLLKMADTWDRLSAVDERRATDPNRDPL
jgi:hypothetical protein